MNRPPIELEPTEDGGEERRLVRDLTRLGAELQSLQDGLDQAGTTLEEQLRLVVRRRLDGALAEVGGLDAPARSRLDPLLDGLAARVARKTKLRLDAENGRIEIRSTRPKKWRHELHERLERHDLSPDLVSEVRHAMERAMRNLDGARLEIDAETRAGLQDVAARAQVARRELGDIVQKRTPPPTPPFPGPPTPPIPEPTLPPNEPTYPGPTQPPEPPVPPAPPAPPLR